LEVVVTRASGLAKADHWGKFDPYVVLIVNGKEVGRTRVLSKTLEPIWSDPEEIFEVKVSKA
ncbi:unnamed protein product, partial [Choristocarpus tenellus]